ncbi:unnamed protein product, partial [Pylaiella littoralis]
DDGGAQADGAGLTDCAPIVLRNRLEREREEAAACKLERWASDCKGRLLIFRVICVLEVPSPVHVYCLRGQRRRTTVENNIPLRRRLYSTPRRSEIRACTTKAETARRHRKNDTLAGAHACFFVLWMSLLATDLT